jgi:hypothetical protein
MIDFVNDNFGALLPLLLIGADFLIGKIPDKWIPYIGIIRRILEARQNKKR